MGSRQVCCVLSLIADVLLTNCRRTFSTWLVYVIGVMYIAMVLGTSGYNYFGLFLKSIKNSDGKPRWSTEDVNLIPIGGSAINVVFGTCVNVTTYQAWAMLTRRSSMGMGIVV